MTMDEAMSAAGIDMDSEIGVTEEELMEANKDFSQFLQGLKENGVLMYDNRDQS